MPTVYNLPKPSGQKVGKKQNFNYVAQGENDSNLSVFEAPFWITNINPTADEFNSIYGVDSDMLSYKYVDNNKTWIFGTHYYDAENGNTKVTSDMLSDLKPYDLKAGSMGNFGVVEKYNIRIINNTSSVRNVKYCIGTPSAFYYEYKINNSYVHNNIKCETDSAYTENDTYYPNLYEILEFEVPAKTNNICGEVYVELSIVIPNVGRGGFYNVMYSN